MRRYRILLVTMVVTLMLAAASHASASPKISVAVSVFDPAIPDDLSAYRDLEIFPRIRRIEAMLWPFQLRQALLDTGEFRIVRVVPEADYNAELSLSATILKSDGFSLDLHVSAIDALGSRWIDRIYRASLEASEDNGDAPDFQHMFDDIAREISAKSSALNNDSVQRLAEVSVLRYAESIAPRAFEGYLQVSDDGTIEVRRLPAAGDPMLERVRMVRETEFVVSDVIDEAFVELHSEIRDVHDLWREYRRRNVEYQEENARRADVRQDNIDRASYEHLKRLYDIYKWDRLTAQEQDRLAVAFNNEVGPRVDALENRIAELAVWVNSKNAEWNRLLEALFEVEQRPEL